jgi:hypothetical protein
LNRIRNVKGFYFGDEPHTPGEAIVATLRSTAAIDETFLPMINFGAVVVE